MDSIAVDDRIHLRLVEKTDAAAIAEANGLMSPDDALRWIDTVLEYHGRGEELPCTICVDGEPAGFVFLEIHPGREGLLHYGLSPDLRGRGIATSACASMIRHAFTGLGLRAIKIDVAVTNERSCRVAERLGFTLMGMVPNPIEGDIARYRLTSELWSGPQALEEEEDSR